VERYRQQRNCEPQMYDDIFAVYAVVYDSFCIICCAVGIHRSRSFKSHPSHTSFLEYLLLFSTSGVLFQSSKRIMGYHVNSETSDLYAAYYLLEFLDMVQALLQIVFYFYAKDVKLPLTSYGGPNNDQLL